MAPYRVSWREGISSSDVIAAIDQAVEDGVVVICIAMGFKRKNLFEDPIAVASFSAMEKGIVVSTAGGNSGPGYKSVRNGFPWVLTVTAGTIDRKIGGTLILGDVLGTSLPNLPLLYDETLSSCTSSALLSQAPDGIVLCNNGDIYKQNDVIVTTNLSVVILTAEDPDAIDLVNVSCPYFVIRPEDVTLVITYAKSVDTPRASMVFKQTFIGMKPAPTVASYASRGPSQYFQNILKPDRSLVLAASIENSTAVQTVSERLVNGACNISSGTSFACPHVAGGV